MRYNTKQPWLWDEQACLVSSLGAYVFCLRISTFPWWQYKTLDKNQNAHFHFSISAVFLLSGWVWILCGSEASFCFVPVPHSSCKATTCAAFLVSLHFKAFRLKQNQRGKHVHLLLRKKHPVYDPVHKMLFFLKWITLAKRVMLQCSSGILAVFQRMSAWSATRPTANAVAL